MSNVTQKLLSIAAFGLLCTAMETRANEVVIINESSIAIEEVSAQEITDPTEVAPAEQLDVDVSAPPSLRDENETLNIPDTAVIADIDAPDCNVDLSIEMADSNNKEIPNFDSCSIAVVIIERSNEIPENLNAP
jgi:hypothetical protein